MITAHFIRICGESGSGKTTVAKAIAEYLNEKKNSMALTLHEFSKDTLKRLLQNYSLEKNLSLILDFGNANYPSVKRNIKEIVKEIGDDKDFHLWVYVMDDRWHT